MILNTVGSLPSHVTVCRFVGLEAWRLGGIQWQELNSFWATGVISADAFHNPIYLLQYYFRTFPLDIVRSRVRVLTLNQLLIKCLLLGIYTMKYWMMSALNPRLCAQKKLNRPMYFSAVIEYSVSVTFTKLVCCVFYTVLRVVTPCCVLLHRAACFTPCCVFVHRLCLCLTLPIL